MFRATNYPSGSVNPRNPSQVAVTFGSYVNSDSNESNGCVPAGLSSVTGANLYTGVKTPGHAATRSCSASPTTAEPRSPAPAPIRGSCRVVTTASGQATTDQWFQWAAFSPTGVLAVSYYDRQYGSDETTGDMDVSVSTSSNLSGFKVSEGDLYVDAIADAVPRRAGKQPVLR